MGSRHRITMIVNGESRACETAGRTSLADLLRDGLQLTGTHLGCEHGVCGCCTVLLDGEPVQRQMLPPSASSMSARLGAGFASSSAVTASTRPGVQ
jgi:aerobic-type carbon monoxide dehydrogenase small subunit (CoxS/CutS family)